MQRCTVAATQVEARHLDVEHNLDAHLQLIGETQRSIARSYNVSQATISRLRA